MYYNTVTKSILSFSFFPSFPYALNVFSHYLMQKQSTGFEFIQSKPASFLSYHEEYSQTIKVIDYQYKVPGIR